MRQALYTLTDSDYGTIANELNEFIAYNEAELERDGKRRFDICIELNGLLCDIKGVIECSVTLSRGDQYSTPDWKDSEFALRDTALVIEGMDNNFSEGELNRWMF